jgi:hypothetical protein
MDERRDRDRNVDRGGAEEEAERRFNDTVRNLLNTPPKPHKAKGERQKQEMDTKLLKRTSKGRSSGDP